MAANPTARTQPPSIYELAAAVVLNDGNLHVVAEQFNLTPEEVLSQLANDPASHELMSRQFRTKALVQQFAVMGDITTMLHAQLADMRADHLVSAFKAIAGSFATLSASGQVAGPGSINNTTQIFERTMQFMPDKVRTALTILKDLPDDDPEILQLLGATQDSPTQLTPSLDNNELPSTSAADDRYPQDDAPRPISPVQGAPLAARTTAKSARARALALLDS